MASKTEKAKDLTDRGSQKLKSAAKTAGKKVQKAGKSIRKQGD